MMPALSAEGTKDTTLRAMPVMPSPIENTPQHQLEGNQRMDALLPLRKLAAVGHQQRNRRGDPARYDRVSQQVMGQVQKTVEHDHGQCHLERHAEKFRHQRNRRQVDRTHEQALHVVGDLEAVMNKRQTHLEWPHRPVGGFHTKVLLMQFGHLNHPALLELYVSRPQHAGAFHLLRCGNQ